MMTSAERKQRKRLLTIICLLLIATITILMPLVTIALLYEKGITLFPIIISFIITIIIDIAIASIFHWRIKSV